MEAVIANAPNTKPGSQQSERLFFLRMAYAIAVTVLAGFGAFAVLGISSFRSPWWVHIHAVSFMSWIALYLLQNHLVVRNSLAQHRRLGLFAAVLAAWMVLLALVLTPVTIAVHRMPPFFTPPQFLALDWINILSFGALVLAGLLLRSKSDWHKRLMLCATICVIAPAVGRLLALAHALTPWTNIGVLLIYVVAAMIADWKIQGRVHPAYFWGGGIIFIMAPCIIVTTGFPPFQDLANNIAG